jgi:hypothetical protein
MLLVSMAWLIVNSTGWLISDWSINGRASAGSERPESVFIGPVCEGFIGPVRFSRISGWRKANLLLHFCHRMPIVE